MLGTLAIGSDIAGDTLRSPSSGGNRRLQDGRLKGFLHGPRRRGSDREQPDVVDEVLVRLVYPRVRRAAWAGAVRHVTMEAL